METRPFRWRGDEVPSEGHPARLAYQQLVDALETAGWASAEVERGPWFAARFVRGVEAPAVDTVDTAKHADRELGPRAAPSMYEATRSEPIVHEAPPIEQFVPMTPPSESLVRAVAPKEPIVREATPRDSVPTSRRPKRAAVASKAPEPTATSRRPRRPRVITVVLALGIATALGGLIAGAAGYGNHRTNILQGVRTTPVATPVVVYTHAKDTQIVASPPSTKATVRVVITAKQTSWFEIRDRSATGRVRYSGELAAGRQLHLSGTRLWARFGAAGNLTITANGRPVTLLGTFEHVFVAPKQ
jgi:hypothetical protein